MAKIMKRTAFVCAVLCVCCLLVPFLFLQNVETGKTASISETIVNDSFETGVAKSTYGIKYFIFDGWTVSNQMSVNADTSIKYQGDKSLVVNGSSGLMVETTNGVAIKGDSYYEFSFMAYAEQADKVSFGLKIDCYNYNDKLTETFSISGAKADSNSTWQKIAVEGGTATLTKYVKIQISIDCQAGAVCYVDSVCMQEKVFLGIKDGASVRISEETPGIRFSGTVDKFMYENMKKRYQNVGVGIVIIPELFYEDISEFTFYGIESGEIPALTIDAEKWYNSNTAETDGFYRFDCAMVNIKKDNISRKFCARAFLKYTDGGVEKYLYSDFDIKLNTRSVQEVAVCVIEKEGQWMTDADLAILEYYASGGQIA